MAAAEPSANMHNQCNRNQYEHEVDKRHYRYLGRMMFDPFQPGQQGRSEYSEEESDSRPHPCPDTLSPSAGGVPK
jgi:hypothetical protein